MLRPMSLRLGRYLARDVPVTTKKPNKKRKGVIKGRYLTKTQDVTVAEDVDTRV